MQNFAHSHTSQSGSSDLVIEDKLEMLYVGIEVCKSLRDATKCLSTAVNAFLSTAAVSRVRDPCRVNWAILIMVITIQLRSADQIVANLLASMGSDNQDQAHSVSKLD